MTALKATSTFSSVVRQSMSCIWRVRRGFRHVAFTFSPMVALTPSKRAVGPSAFPLIATSTLPACIFLTAQMLAAVASPLTLSLICFKTSAYALPSGSLIATALSIALGSFAFPMAFAFFFSLFSSSFSLSAFFLFFLLFLRPVNS